MIRSDRARCRSAAGGPWGLVVVILLTTGAARAAPAEEGLALLQDFIDETRTLRAEFEQQLLDAEGIVAQESSGTLWIHRPDRFRWNYLEPYEQVVVSDGKRLWYYDSDLAQATVKRLDESFATTPAMLLSGSARVSERFALTESRIEDGLTWIALQPLAQDTDFRELTVVFEGRELRGMRLVDSLDQTTILRFHSIVRNIDLDDDLFAFEPPAGVDVIGDVDAPALQ